LDATSFAAYEALQKSGSSGLTFSQLLKETGKTPRVLSNQLKRLMERGVVIRRPIEGSDRRSRWVYQIGPGWPWLESHHRVIRDVARAISERRVYFDLTAGAHDPGRDGILVYTDLVVESPDSSKAGTYPSGVQDFKKVNQALKAVREALQDVDPDGYHWQFLLRRIIAEIVTSQPRSFFLLSYPDSCFAYESKGVKWPDPRWQEAGVRTIPLPPLTSTERKLAARYSLEVYPFREDHSRRFHPRSKVCRCSEKRLLDLFGQWRLRRVEAPPV
jgi:DNA-binding transcriptional ArsR family regulator